MNMTCSISPLYSSLVFPSFCYHPSSHVSLSSCPLYLFPTIPNSVEGVERASAQGGVNLRRPGPFSCTTHRTCKNQPAADAGRVGHERETAERELAAMKRAIAQGGRFWGDPARSRALPIVPIKINLLRVQGVWDMRGRWLRESWRP